MSAYQHAADGSRRLVICERSRIVRCCLCGRGIRVWHPDLPGQQCPDDERCGDFEAVQAAFEPAENIEKREWYQIKAEQKRTGCEQHRRSFRNYWGGV